MSQRLSTDERIQKLELEIEELAKDVQAYKDSYQSQTASDQDTQIRSDSEDVFVVVDELTDFLIEEQAEFIKRLLCPEKFPDDLD